MGAIVVQVMPVWGRIGAVEALTGCPENVLRRLANEGLVRARKMSDSDNSACVYRVQDVLDWLEDEAPKPQKYRVAGAGA